MYRNLIEDLKKMESLQTQKTVDYTRCKTDWKNVAYERIRTDRI